MGNSPGEIYGYEFNKSVSAELRQKYIGDAQVCVVSHIGDKTRVITNLRDFGDRTEPRLLAPGVVQMVFVKPELA